MLLLFVASDSAFGYWLLAMKCTRAKTMQHAAVTIDYLAHHQALAAELARWSWNEWRVFYTERGRTFDDALSSYHERAQLDSLPLALVAFADGKLVGTASLKAEDLATRPEITPWLASVFVVPKWRQRGVASLLTRRVVEEARRLNLPTLFLWTSSAEGLYLKLGWRALERTEYCGKRIVIMRLEIAEK